MVFVAETSLNSTRTCEMKKMMKTLDSKAEDNSLTNDHIHYAVYTVVRIKNINIKFHKQ